MDFSIAYLMEYTNNQVLTVTIESDGYLLTEMQKSPTDNNLLKLPDQEKLSSYYRKISDYIIDYEEVILLGPTSSKNELFSILLLDPLFDRINMSVKDAVRMNDSERESFIRSNAVRTDRTPSAFRKRESSFVEYEPFGYFTSEVKYDCYQ
jgi:hypothetical protein